MMLEDLKITETVLYNLFTNGIIYIGGYSYFYAGFHVLRSLKGNNYR